MSLTLHKDCATHVVEVKVTGKLTGQDYQQAAPKLDEFIRQCGKVRMVFDMHDFHGWKLKGLWADYKFGRQHGHDLERLALVGEKHWQRWSSKLCRFFTDAEVRYFDRSHANLARLWVTTPTLTGV